MIEGKPQLSIPMFVKTLVDQEAPAESTIALSCSTSGDAPMQATWRRNGLPIDQRTMPHIQPMADSRGGFQLVLSRAQTSDSGWYDCLVTNAAGEARCSAYLNVTRKFV